MIIRSTLVVYYEKYEFASNKHNHSVFVYFTIAINFYLSVTKKKANIWPYLIVQKKDNQNYGY